MTNLNAPMGYFGNPLIEHSLMDFNENTTPTLSYSSSGSSSWSYQSPVNSYISISQDPVIYKFKLMELPSEVISQIFDILDQNDCISLMSCCKSLYDLGGPRLWRCIVVNRHYSEFNTEMIQIAAANNSNALPTFIKTSFRLRSLLSTISKSKYRFSIRKLHFTSVPLDFLDYELRTHLSNGLFAKISSLQELAINTKIDSTPLSLLSSIPLGLSSLSVSLDLCSEDIALYTQLNLKLHQYRSLFPFKNLTKLDLALNFDNSRQNSRVLYYIFKSMIVSGNTLSQFKMLKIANNSNLFSSDTTSSTVLINNYPRLSTENDSLMDIDVLTNLFLPAIEANLRFELDSLWLEGFLVTPEQADLVCSCINLSKLSLLKLLYMSEFQLVDVITASSTDYFSRNRESIISKLKPGFLQRIAPHLHNIKDLTLDYKECLKDSVITMVNLLPTKSLKSFGTTVRWNMKCCRRNSDLNFYVDSLLNQLSYFKDLSKVSLDIKWEIKPILNPTVHQEILPSELFLRHLKLFKQLTCLRVLCHSLEHSLVHTLLTDDSITLNRLQCFDLFGSGAGGQPNMALEVVHAGVFDDWFKVQHIAIHLSKNNVPNLTYIRINNCLFEVKHGSFRNSLAGIKEGAVIEEVDVIPREGHWFNEYLDW